MKQEISRFGRVLAGLGEVGDDGVRDTELVHVNPFEIEILKALGGVGTVNPRTGLRQFKYGADTNEGGATGTGKGKPDKNRGNDGNNPGNPNTGMAGGPNYSGPKGKGTGVDGNNPSNKAPGGGGKNDGNNPGNPNAPGYLNYDTQITEVNGAPISVGDLRTKYIDYDNTYNGIMDDIGNMIAGAFGWSEINPFDKLKGWGTPGSTTNPQKADWAFDPVEFALGLGGFAFPGLNLAGTAYNLAQYAGIVPENGLFSVNMGTDVLAPGEPSFGATTKAPTGFGAAALGNQSGTTSSASGTSSPPQTDIGRGGGTGYGSVISANTTKPAPIAPKPESQASPSVSSGPLPPGVSIIQPPVPIRNRDTGAWTAPFINGSGFSGGYGSIVRI